MIRLLMRHIGEGRFVCATATDLRLALAKCPTQHALWHEVQQPRSAQQNYFIYGLIKKAFDNQQGDRFESADHLMAVALCTVGHKVTTFFPLPDKDARLRQLVIDVVSKLIGALRRQSAFAFVRSTKRGLAVDVPKPWAFDKLKHEDATRLVQEIADWLVSDEGPVPGSSKAQLFAAMEDPQ